MICMDIDVFPSPIYIHIDMCILTTNFNDCFLVTRLFKEKGMEQSLSLSSRKTKVINIMCVYKLYYHHMSPVSKGRDSYYMHK